MTPVVEIISIPIDLEAVYQSIHSTRCGSHLIFLGTAREFTDGKQTSSLEYEAYPEMAIKELNTLCSQAAVRWPIETISITHRIGPIDLGEICIALAIGTAHRQEGFESAQWIMNQLKQVVPIWKKEIWTDGQTEWIHPSNQKSTPN